MIAVHPIMFSTFDLAAYLPIAREALGHGVSGKADAASVCDEIHNMMCTAGLFGGEAADVDHLYFVAYIIACDERDMPDVLSLAGMPHISVESQVRGLRVAILSGSLPEWRNALRKGCGRGCGSEVRKVYNRVANDLTNRGLEGIIGVVERKPQPDSTFLLEFKA